MNNNQDPMGRAIAGVYYGEQIFHMEYKDTIGKPFPWLYIDKDKNHQNITHKWIYKVRLSNYNYL